ncbi:MAG: hypothetical protein AAF541_06335 [Pseudomonadota bacterium]
MKTWSEYLEKFGLSADEVRPGCEPLIAEQDQPVGSAILIHGLSDSPHYMKAIGEHLHKRHGLNVYLPLLHAHGLAEPEGMEAVSLESWKENVVWCIDQAALATPAAISIGGLSTGGVLSFWASMNDARINQHLLLFSAALDLLIAGSSLFGAVAERLVRNRLLNDLLDWRNRDKPLIGQHPFRYDYVDYDGARELCRLLLETDLLINGLQEDLRLAPSLFVAHSYADATADIEGVLRLLNAVGERHPQSRFLIEHELAVGHAELVLADPVTVGGQIIETSNSEFAKMVERMDKFVSENSAI